MSQNTQWSFLIALALCLATFQATRRTPAPVPTLSCGGGVAGSCTEKTPGDWHCQCPERP
jgi:hypothetical protein